MFKYEFHEFLRAMNAPLSKPSRLQSHLVLSHHIKHETEEKNECLNRDHKSVYSEPTAWTSICCLVWDGPSPPCVLVLHTERLEPNPSVTAALYDSSTRRQMN